MTRRMTVALAFSLAAAVTPAAGAQQANGSITGSVKVAGETNNADVVVYVEHAAGPFKPAAPAVMDQKSLKFVPHVLNVVAGTTVKFTNSDTVAHNVFSPDHEKYNLGTFNPGQAREHTFAKCPKFPCVYVQLCNIHPEMEGFVVVTQNPYVATTNEAGQFTIADVPPGKYQVAVWYAKGKAQPKPVSVEAGKPSTVDFSLGK